MTTPAPVVDADRIATAVLACPAVAGLHPGPFGEVGITARFGTLLAGAAEQVRAAVAAVSPALTGLGRDGGRR